MSAQIRYWQTFSTLKRDAIYINRYHGRVERIDRLLNMFSAMASSGSVAGWIIWKDLGLVWGAVIALSQALNAVKPYLPFRRRLAALAALGPDLEALALVAEADWFKVSDGQLTEQEIHSLMMALKTKAQRGRSRAPPCQRIGGYWS
ncbi:MAG: hypothetical protein JF588_10635 [Caulobacterales bacterium]|nr:hypothetical protein [Caulobacterales bacterium]